MSASAELDAAYRGFPPFSEWAKCMVDVSRWGRYTHELNRLKGEAPGRLARALEVVKRAAAVDTGAIEGLYETDRGFTFTVAMEMAHWEAALAERGANVTALFRSQLAAYDYVLDLATLRTPIAEAWIRTLHERICAAQETYPVRTEIGSQEHPLPKGMYKVLPNHVARPDGQFHSYAPVDMTAPEMHRLCQELRGDEFLRAHPVLQASYAHYALVVVHPFADGNGRVARALESVFMVRSQFVPLLILADTRRDYIAALEAADAGAHQIFVDFVLERALDAFRLTVESLKSAEGPALETTVTGLRSLYVTKGGYSQRDVDEAGYRLFEIFRREVEKRAWEVSVEGVFTIKVDALSGDHGVRNVSYRLPVEPKRLGLRFVTAPPIEALVHKVFGLEVPKDCGVEDDLAIVEVEGSGRFESRVSELAPAPNTAVQMRVTIAVERMTADALDELRREAARKMNREPSP